MTMHVPMAHRRRLSVAGLASLVVLALCLVPVLPAQTGKDKAKTKPKNAVAMEAVGPEEWTGASTEPLAPGELDKLIDGELAGAKIKLAPKTSDEQFIRRVYLDVIGTIPRPADITAFVEDQDKDKRAKLIDKLLDSDDYAKNWARYWRTVTAGRISDFLALLMVPTYERWLTEQFKKNVSWGEMVKAMITATGSIKRDEPDKNGQAFFLLAYRGADALPERTAETARAFMGIQIQCAQCHDHPFDDWKRNQFHELAAFLVRTKDFPIFDDEKKMILGFQLVAAPFGEHKLVDKDKKLNEPMSPRFLDGTSPGKSLTDKQRRDALAKYVTSKKNAWFAAAFVNRMWAELLGQSFYQPVDDLGPQREAVMPKVVARLAGAFRGGDYDIKQLLRTILTTDAYQRQSQTGKSTDEHLFFAASYPKKLNATAFINSLEAVLGKFDGGFGGPKGGGFGPFGGFGVKGQINKEFSYDPSSRPEEIEGTLPQALILMNNPAINQKIKANGLSMLGQLLKKHPDNTDAVKQLYLSALCRHPSANELKVCLGHIEKAANRTTAFEDLLWVMMNCTEFQTKR